MTAGEPARCRSWRPLIALETATLLAAAGNGVALVAFPWVVLDLTGSAADAGLVAAIASLPLVLSAFASGTLVGLRASFLLLSLVLVAVALASPFVRALRGLDHTGATART